MNAKPYERPFCDRCGTRCGSTCRVTPPAPKHRKPGKDPVEIAREHLRRLRERST